MSAWDQGPARARGFPCSGHTAKAGLRGAGFSRGCQQVRVESTGCNRLNKRCCLCTGSILNGSPPWTTCGAHSTAFATRIFHFFAAAEQGKTYSVANQGVQPTVHCKHTGVPASAQKYPREVRPCSLSPFLQEEMVWVASLLIKFHPKRQKGAGQIFRLQELKPPHSLSCCPGELAEMDKHLLVLLILAQSSSAAYRALGLGWVANWGESAFRLLIPSSTGLDRNGCPCYSDLGKVVINGY